MGISFGQKCSIHLHSAFYFRTFQLYKQRKKNRSWFSNIIHTEGNNSSSIRTWSIFCYIEMVLIAHHHHHNMNEPWKKKSHSSIRIDIPIKLLYKWFPIKAEKEFARQTKHRVKCGQCSQFNDYPMSRNIYFTIINSRAVQRKVILNSITQSNVCCSAIDW